MYLESLFGLHGKVAVVTGGSRGIGQVIANGLAKAGAEIVILSRSNASELVDNIKNNGGKAYWIRTDVTNEEGVEHAIEEIRKQSDKIDILFNNAGICIHQDTIDMTTEDFRNVLDVNLTGQFIVAKAVGKLMIEKRIRGSIINMASMSGSIVNTPQMQVSYNASKAAVIHMTKSLAVEWSKYEIKVNSLSPGYVATAMSEDTPQELKDAWMQLIPLQRMANPEELIPPVLFLASDKCQYAIGSDVVIDGGYTCL